MSGWPGKPGVPMNPEKDGWHWIYDKYLGPECALWIAKSCCWQMAGAEVLSIQKWRYLGPCFTPDGTAALQARIAELEAEVKMWRNEDKKKQTACEQMGSRIAELEAALDDALTYVWRAHGWSKLKPETQAYEFRKKE
jgi:hypothetical protein